MASLMRPDLTSRPSRTPAGLGLAEIPKGPPPPICTPISDADYTFVRDFIYEETRIDLGNHKRELVSVRLAKRLRANHCPTYAEYCSRLRNELHSDERQHLIDAITTNHTFFFREAHHFDFLSRVVLPEFARGDFNNRGPFRVWSSACSTGEEPYSIAITLADFFNDFPQQDWRIDCSDVSTRVLKFASEGIYEKTRLEALRPEWIPMHFHKGTREREGYYRVRSELRGHLSFKQLNLFSPAYPWLDRFHAIFCRNAMIYFDERAQQSLVRRLAQHLVPGGYLMIGHSESLARFEHSFESVRPAIYRLPR